MKIIIKSVNFKTGIVLQEFVREKIRKLFNHYKNIIRANVILREGKNRNQNNKLCEIRLIIPGNDLFVKKRSAVYENSVLQAVEVLQKTLNRKKTKVITNRHTFNSLTWTE